MMVTIKIETAVLQSLNILLSLLNHLFIYLILGEIKGSFVYIEISSTTRNVLKKVKIGKWFSIIL